MGPAPSDFICQGSVSKRSHPLPQTAPPSGGLGVQVSEPMEDILIQTLTVAVLLQDGIRVGNDSTRGRQHCSRSRDSQVNLAQVVWHGAGC